MADPDWEDIRAFNAAAAGGSLGAAARETGLSVPTLSRRIDSLERDLGLKLFRRGPSGMVLTADGSTLLPLAVSGGRKLGQIERAARVLGTGPSETPIRVSATEPMICDVLAPRLARLLDLIPDIRLELEVSADLTDLDTGRCDMAVRMTRPAGPDLMARRLSSIGLSLYASADYLAGRDPVQLDLGNERLCWFDDSYGDIPEILWVREQGLIDAIVMRSNASRALFQAACSGTVIAPVPDFLARLHGLIEVPSAPLPKRQPWLVFHRDTRAHPVLKTVRDWIATSCRSAFTEG